VFETFPITLNSMDPTALKGINLYLIGMMGAGKSTVGRLVAESLGYRFFDTDTLMEQTSRTSIPELFAQLGESKFRDLETQVLAQLSAYTRLAIATGGGIVLRPINWSYLRHGVVVWLDVPLSELEQRLSSDTSRPLLRPDPAQPIPLAQRLHTVWQQRQHLYAQADVQVMWEPGATPEQIAAQVWQQVQGVIKVPPGGDGV
jgi:shikimate kinase